MRTVPICAMVLLASTTWASAQGSAEAPNCGEFELNFANGRVQAIAAEDDASNIGDRRVGIYDLLDLNRTVVGQVLFESTVVGQHEGSYLLIANVQTVFDNGILTDSYTHDLPDPLAPPLPERRTREYVYPVTGGTGEFWGARGVIRAVMRDDGERWLLYDLECGD